MIHIIFDRPGIVARRSEGAVGGPVKKKKRKLVRRRKKKPVVEVDVPSEESVLLEPPLGVSRVADRVADAKGGAEEVPSEAAEEYPDLDMLDAPDLTDEERLRAERLGRLGGGDEGPAAPADSGEPDWFTASAEDVASEVLDRNKADPAMETFKTNRFQSQLSAEEWNSQVMANEDELAPRKFHVYPLDRLDNAAVAFWICMWLKLPNETSTIEGGLQSSRPDS